MYYPVCVLNETSCCSIRLCSDPLTRRPFYPPKLFMYRSTRRRPFRKGPSILPRVHRQSANRIKNPARTMYVNNSSTIRIPWISRIPTDHGVQSQTHSFISEKFDHTMRRIIERMHAHGTSNARYPRVLYKSNLSSKYCIAFVKVDCAANRLMETDWQTMMESSMLVSDI